MGERTPPCGACWPPPVAGLSSARQGGSHRLAAPQAISPCVAAVPADWGWAGYARSAPGDGAFGSDLACSRPPPAPCSHQPRSTREHKHLLSVLAASLASLCQAASMVAGMEPNAENKLFVGGCPAGSGEEDLRTVRCPPPAPAHHIIL